MSSTTDTLLERLHLIPDDLIERPQWLVWRLEDGQRKEPYQAMRPTRRAKSNDPTTWATFAQAVDVFADRLAKPNQFTGIGYVFSADDPFTGVDLDKCVDGDTIHPEARKIIEAIPGYAEISPSLTGVKIWTRAKLPIASTGKQINDMPWGGVMELYHRARYFAVTGREVTP